MSVLNICVGRRECDATINVEVVGMCWRVKL